MRYTSRARSPHGCAVRSYSLRTSALIDGEAVALENAAPGCKRRKGTVVSHEFDKTYWEEHYRGHSPGHQRQASPHLVTEAGVLTPGRALDAGCGEGADTFWLAARGWHVTAVDIATAALRRAREHAESLGADISHRIDWVQADLTSWTPARGHFDLVSTHYVHTAASWKDLFGRLAAAVAPGGTLLVVGHHPSDTHSSAHASGSAVHFTAEEATAELDPGRWDIVVAETRARWATRPDGHQITLRDAVLRAHRRP